MFKIITFEPQYRDDMLFCFLSAKDALGRVPALRDDLLDIQKNYFDNGDMFYLAIDYNQRVIGMIGTHTISTTELWLKRFFIKPMLKRTGIGSKLLAVVETYAQAKGITTIHTRFNDDYAEALRFYSSKSYRNRAERWLAAFYK
jgi:GNAT superfamily N-acetyltransferase